MRNKQINKLMLLATVAGIFSNLLPVQKASAQVATPAISIAAFQGDCDNGIGNEESYYIRISTGLYSINGNDKNLSGVTVLLDASGSNKYDPSNPSDTHKTTLRNAITSKQDPATSTNYTTATANRVIAALDAAEKMFCGSSSGSNGGVTVTVEAPGTQTTQLPNSNYYVVNFDNRTLPANAKTTFNVTNGGTTYGYGSGLEIQTANQWGGAGSSQFITQASAAAGSNKRYQMTVSEDQRYFGFWWSAGDGSNKIIFKNDGNVVKEFLTADLYNFTNNNSAYKGNPNCSANNSAAPCNNNVGHRNEPYAFVNVFFDNQAYDEIVVEVLNGSSAGFESDNHTFSAANQLVSGSVVSDTAPPDRPVITSVTNPTTTPTVAGTAEANSTITIQVGDVITTTTTNSSGNWSVNLFAPMSSNGQNLNVRATDAAGNTSTPSGSTPPTITSSLNTNDTTPTITGTGQPGSTITIKKGDDTLVTTTTDSSGNWTATIPDNKALPSGNNNLTATSTSPGLDPSSATSFRLVIGSD